MSAVKSVFHEVAVLPTRKVLMETAAERLVSAAAKAIGTTGRFCVAFSGGSTPQTLYALLATDPYVSRMDWSRIHVFWGDERCVPAGDPESNFRMAREALLDHVAVPERNVHRIPGENDPAEAARAYEDELRKLFKTPAGPPRLTPGRRFDLILLGLGEDGHTASLFPRSKAVRETERWVTAEQIAGIRTTRVTLTPTMINAAAEIVFLVSGGEKAVTLHRVVEGPHHPDLLPAQAIDPLAGRMVWLADASAAAELGKERRGR